MRLTSIIPEFVVHVPDVLAEGVVYVSTTYGTALHLCVCGCGNEVVTPISPTDWQLTHDDDGTITLTPSILNRFACGSHYWIRSNQIEWA